MSKQFKAKTRQGYDSKPVHRMCKNCEYFQFELDYSPWIKERIALDGAIEYMIESNKTMQHKRCGIGGFAVKMQAVCKEHEFKVNNDS